MANQKYNPITCAGCVYNQRKIQHCSLRACKGKKIIVSDFTGTYMRQVGRVEIPCNSCTDMKLDMLGEVTCRIYMKPMTHEGGDEILPNSIIMMYKMGCQKIMAAYDLQQECKITEEAQQMRQKGIPEPVVLRYVRGNCFKDCSNCKHNGLRAVKIQKPAEGA